MISRLRQYVVDTLRWSEKYAKTDMVEFGTNNAWLFVGRVISVGSGMVLTVAFANLLSPTSFGTYKYILSMAALVGAFSLSGVGGAAIRAVAQGYKNIVPRLFWFSVLCSMPASFVALCIAMYYFYMGNAILGTGMAFIAVTNHFVNAFVLSKSVFIGANEYQAPALYGIPRSLIPILFLIAALLFTDNLMVIFAAYFTGSFLFGYLMYTFAVRQAHIDSATGYTPENDAAFKEAKKYGFHISIMGSASVIAAQVDQLLLWHFIGPVELAIYAFAFAPVREIKGQFESLTPMLFSRFSMRSKEELRKSIPLRVRQTFLVAVLCTVLYIIAAPFIFHTLFPQYTNAIVLSQILALVLLFQPRNVIDSAIASQAQTTLRYFTVGGAQFARVALSVILIPPYGLYGAIASLVLSEFLSALIIWVAYYFSYKKESGSAVQG